MIKRIILNDRIKVNWNVDIHQALFSKKGNIKLGEIWSFSKLYGETEYYFPDWNIAIQGTCKGCCKCCEKCCYVRKSYRYSNVIYSHAIHTLAMREKITVLFTALDEQIKRANKKPIAIRINQSGEMETREEIINWIELSRKYPNIMFFFYTKRLNILETVLNEYGNENMPKNISILISVWNEYGVKEYNRMKHFDCIKAFVYDDGYDYKSIGLTPDTTCKAYENGKLNHNITCEKCGKCFHRRKDFKVIFCKEHD